MQQNLVFKYFAEICKIPHVSGNEQALGKYIVSVLKQSNCEIKIDKIGNVYASRHVNSSLPGICFQAHLDMVGEKSSTSSHNFQTDPIKFYEKDG
jgi:dipeptidase D